MSKLPPEIIIMVMSVPQTDLPTLLRCVRACKSWQSLIYKSNSLRSKLFIPPHSKFNPQRNTDGICRATSLEAEIRVDIEGRERIPSAESIVKLNEQTVEIHPLLLRHRITKKRKFSADESRIETRDYENDLELSGSAAEEAGSGVEVTEDQAEDGDNSAEDDETMVLKLSYRLLNHFFRLQQLGATSWQDMYATRPPVSDINLGVELIWCAKDTCHITKKLHIPGGITIKDIFDAVCDTRLLRNLGLAPEDESCIGDAAYPCACYNFFGDLQQNWENARRLSGESRSLEQ
ncbi:hypothetical protein FB567DRAFT_586682 [Paraphoma chrysanthemicola]|uniref:F-box domain-containing protein n=1 Tax=Paraphoma chrysanthemicola TaxID=798071 RepID=A0A8K0RK98_9PLEO|nr:hypothetical protein FB567DRAFT_586682 [Paraphoma chrysanthemicola]